MKLSDTEAAYAAGVLDGEGSVQFTMSPYPSAPLRESMSRCRAYPFRVHPSGSASAHASGSFP